VPGTKEGEKKVDLSLLTISEKGFGKSTKTKEYRVQKRGGSGIKTAKVVGKTGKLIAAKVINPDFEELIAISKKGQILKIKLKEVSKSGRQTQGVKIMALKPGDTVASITCV